MSRNEIFPSNSPSLVVEATTVDDDGSWLANGYVVFELSSGDCLQFEFKKARSANEAREQALLALEAHLKRFSRAAEALRKPRG